jgi:hypothetical protein
MTGRQRIFVGDLVRALSSAGSADGKNWWTIAAMLGLTQSTEMPQSRSDDQGSEITPGLNKGAGESASGGAVAAASRPDQLEGIGELVTSDVERSRAPAQRIVPAAAVEPERLKSPLPLRPLLDPLWERGILIEAAGTPSSEGGLVVLEAVERIARGEPLLELPRERIQSVSKGCQLLIDTGLGMQPFAGDCRQVTHSFRRAVGAEHTVVLTFVDCPTNGVMTANYVDHQYGAPENGAIVVALTDLCRGGPRSAIREAEPQDWLEVAKTIRDVGSSLVVLNPYPPERWPSEVVEQLAVVHWDISTRAANVRGTRRRVRR